MSAPPLVLLHGFLGCAADWDDVRAALEPAIACVALDLPGHGARPAPVAASDFEGGIAQVRREIAERGIERCHLIGYSMGGRLALGLAVRHPELVASTIAVGAGTGLRDEAERERRRALDDERARELETDFEAFLERWYGMDLFAPLRAHARFREMLERRRRGQPDQLARALRAFSLGRQPCLDDGLAAAETRILLLAGSLDTKFAASNARLAARCPTCVCGTVAGAGHSPHLENATELARLVTAFLAGAG